MAVFYASGAWWSNGVAYTTQEAANAAEAAGKPASDPSLDFNSDVINAIPTTRAPIATTSSAGGNAIRDEIARLASVPYGTPASAGGTATQYQATAQPAGGVFKNDSFVTHRVNPDGSLTVVADATGSPNAQVGSAPVGSAPYNPAKPGASVGRTAIPGANSAGNSAVFQGVGSPQFTQAGTGAPAAPAGGGGLPPIPATAPTADQRQADDARQQQDRLIAQLVQEANRTQSAPAVDTTGYNQSRDQGNATYNALTALSGNNISNIQANGGQRDQSRGALLGTASSLTSAANQNIANQDANAAQRNATGSSLQGLINQLQAQAGNNVSDIQVNNGQYNTGRDVSSDIIQRLIAEAQRPEGPSAAEALMLSGQERAQRNAIGDAISQGGGWRSQLVNERRAEGLGAQMSAEAAAQSAALRANEETQYRTDVRNALAAAGGLQSDVSGRDLALGTTNAGLLAQIRQGNQTNARESLTSAGQTELGKLTSDTGFATSEADRRADIAKANQLNKLNALLGAGNLQGTALTSDTGFAVSNAQIQADVAKANQANSLQAQIAAANSAQARLESDRALATSNADRAERVSQNNAQNSINALQAAGVISTNTRTGDIQIAQGDQQTISQMAIAAAGNISAEYAAQLQYAVGMANVEQRKAELARLKAQDPSSFQRWVAALGSMAVPIAMIAK